MDSIQKNTNNQTPIEIALGIDENGMTTARKLYEFLGLAKGQFSRWAKTNITENSFAEENVDYWGFDINVEGNVTQDFKLSANFAKKLSMQQKNDRGEEARDYYVKLEDKSKDLVLLIQKASNNPMEMLKIHYQALEQIDKKVDAVTEDVKSVKDEMEEIKDNLPILPLEADSIVSAVKKRGVDVLGGKQSAAYNDRVLRQKIYNDIYGDLKRNFNCKTYKAIRRKDVGKAVQIVTEYRLPLCLSDEIKMTNAQRSLFEKDEVK